MIGMLGYPLKMTYNSVVGGFNATFPGANLANNDYGRVARTTSGATGTYAVTFDLGSAKTVDLLGLLWHNLRAGDSISVYASNTPGASDLLATSATAAITGSSNKETAAPGKWLMTLANPVAARYWRVNMICAGSANPDGYLQASRFVVGRQTQFQIGAQQAELNAADMNQRVTIETGEDRTSEDSLLIRPISQLNFNYAKLTELDQILAKYTLGLGTSLPMMVVDDLLATYLQDHIVFGRPEQIVAASSEFYDVWKFQARVRSYGP